MLRSWLYPWYPTRNVTITAKANAMAEVLESRHWAGSNLFAAHRSAHELVTRMRASSQNGVGRRSGQPAIKPRKLGMFRGQITLLGGDRLTCQTYRGYSTNSFPPT